MQKQTQKKCEGGGKTSFLSKLRRGFTITELVIVIAVVAILAAVLIPTFTNIVNKANESADTQLVKNLNTILSSEQTVSQEAAPTMSEAIAQAQEGGYTVDKLTPTSDGDILWEQDSNRFVLVSGGKIIFKDSTTKADISKESYKFWKIVDNENEAETGAYSAYLKEGFAGGNSVSLDAVAHGIDVGSNTNIASIAYETQNPQTVIFKTVGATTLKINATNSTVKHYGDSGNVEITAVADNSYHFYGTVGNISVYKGRVVAENGSAASLVLATATGSSTVTVDILAGAKVPSVKTSGNVNVNPAADSETEVSELTNEEEELLKLFAAGSGTSESSPFEIRTEAQLRAISVLSGFMQTKPYYFKLTDNITLNRASDNDYITTNFNGVFDGNGKSITVDIASGGSVSGRQMGYGTYWFFASPAGDVTIKNLTVFHESGKNVAICEAYNSNFNDWELRFENVDMGNENTRGETLTMFRNASGYVIYVSGRSLVFDGCDNYYNLQSADPQLYSGVYIGGYFLNATKNVEFKNCINYGDIKGARIGIFFGNFQPSYIVKGNFQSFSMQGCQNYGQISYFISGDVLGQNLKSTDNLYYYERTYDVKQGKYVYTKTDEVFMSVTDILKGYTEHGSINSLVDPDMKLTAEGDSYKVTPSERADISYKLMYSAYANWTNGSETGSQIVTLYFDLPVIEGTVSAEGYRSGAKFMDKNTYITTYGKGSSWGSDVTWRNMEALEDVTYYYDAETNVYVFDFSAVGGGTEYTLSANSVVALCAYDENENLIAIAQA